MDFLYAYTKLLEHVDNCNIRNVLDFNSPIIYSYVDFLNEGLVATYPIDFFLKSLEKRFHLVRVNNYSSIKHIEYGIYYYIDDLFRNTDECIIQIRWNGSIDKNFLEDLKEFCNACGYFVSVEGERALNIESKIGKDVSKDIIEKNEYLYHICPTMNLKGILNNGLVPKSRNDLYDYPDRIYLFTESILENRNKFHDILYKEKKLYYDSIADMLCGSGDTEEYKKMLNNGYCDPKSFAILKIAVKKLKNNRFFIDSNFGNTSIVALYTTENIHPNAIQIYKILDISEYIEK